MLKPLIKGTLTLIPGMQSVLPKPIASQQPPIAYYYGVWLKHVSILAKNGLYSRPKVVAELGPGDSLGIGIAAVLTGAERYYGLDIVRHTTMQQDVAALEQIYRMFAQRAPRPTKGWPDFDGLLDERLFPSSVLTDELLSFTLDPERVGSIRKAMMGERDDSGSPIIDYRVPWDDDSVIEPDSVDLVISQAVLEHVPDIRSTYRSLYKWLKPGGVMSHQIDLRSHGMAKKWNGHLGISETVWKLMAGNRPYLLNREPWSAHQAALRACGFEVLCIMKHRRDDGIARPRLAKRWRELSDDDLSCSEVFFQARKPMD